MPELVIDRKELEYRKSLPLKDKIDLTCDAIEKWHSHWDSQIYVSFSGGRDSTVLLDIVRTKAFIPDAQTIPAVFCDTGLEYPEIREFVKTIPNVTWLRPKMTFRQVIEHYGYPVISKEQSNFIGELQTTKSEKLKDIRLNGNKWGLGKVSEKWKFLVNSPYKISDKCCDILKKNPAHGYEKATGRKPILGSRVTESQMREVSYMRTGCNAYNSNRPVSMPLAFWSEQDVLDYIKLYNLPYSKIYDMGYDRTGCMFCMYGIQRESNPNRFEKMAVTHPKIYDFCMNDLGIKDLLDYINRKGV